jgi:hypothetical protein
MEPYVYIERSRLGRTIYALRAGVLNISGTRCGRRFDCDICLREVVGRPQPSARRFYRKIVIGLLVAVPTGAITLGLVLQRSVPEQAAHHYAHFTAVAFAAAFGTALTWIPEVRYLSFRNSRGDTLFDVLQPRTRRTDFEEFLRRLNDAVAAARRAQVPKPMGSTGSPQVVQTDAAARITPPLVVAQL